MKIVLDIETVQAPWLEWARVRGMVFQKPHSREDVLRMPQYNHVD